MAKRAAASGPVEGRWVLPDGWSWRRARDLGRIVGGSTPKNASDPTNYCEDGVPWLTPADLSGYTHATIGAGRRNLASHLVKESALLPAGSVLISSRAPVGYCAVASNPMVTNQGFRSIVPNGEIDPFLLRYYVLFSRRYLEDYASGTTFKELSGGALADLVFPVAPLQAQRRIVARIDELFAGIEEGEAALARAQDDLGTWRKALLKAAVTGELTADWRAERERRAGEEDEPPAETGPALLTRLLAERRARWDAEPKNRGKRYKEPVVADPDTLPPLPDGWAWATLSQLAGIGSGTTPSRSEPEYWNGDLPWLKSGCVNDTEVFAADEYVTPLAFRNARLKTYPVGTLVVALYGEGKTRGKCAVLQIAATINQALAAVQVDESVGADWIKIVLDANYEENRTISSGGVQPNLNLVKLGALPIPLPSALERSNIIDMVSYGLTAHEELSTVHNSSMEESSTLRQSILAAAFRGELA